MRTVWLFEILGQLRPHEENRQVDAFRDRCLFLLPTSDGGRVHTNRLSELRAGKAFGISQLQQLAGDAVRFVFERIVAQELKEGWIDVDLRARTLILPIGDRVFADAKLPRHIFL